MGCNKLYNFLGMFLVFGIMLFLLFYFIFSINFVIGEVQVSAGNNSGDIDTVYAPSQAIRGWINISLVNEPSNSLLTAFNSNIKILDFLKNNLENKYNCTPRDCSDSYDISNGSASKSFSIKRGESKIIGLKLTGKLSDSPILDDPDNLLSFNFDSTAPESCIEPLRIDITDDDYIDWIPITGSGNYDCYNVPYYGCYNKNANLTQRELSTSAYYCEKIRVQKSPSLKIGAYINVAGDKNPTMSMKVLDADLQDISGGSCTIPGITGSSEVSCTVNVGFLQDSDIYVCIKANSANNYKIDAENQQPTCGFYDIENHNDLSWDYSIFAEGGKYAAIGSFVFDDSVFRKFDNDNEKLKDYMNEYLDFKYNSNCENGCVIPIKFIAGEDQQITLSNLLLKYNTDSGVITESNFYNANKNSAKLNSGFLKLDLGKANLSVPSDIKNDTAVIKIGDKEILSKNIQIKAVPVIKELMPLNPPASVPVTFSVVMERAEANMSFVWNFGDNSSQETSNENTIKHTYAAIGKYKLTIKAIGKSGEFSRIFDINVVSPMSLINKTISGYEDDIKNTETQISQLPDWIKSEVEKKINLTDIKYSVNMQKRKYESGVDDATAVQIMRALLNLKVPTSIYVSMEVQPSGFLMKKEAVDIDLLSELGAGKVNSTRDEYYKRIISWIRDNLNVSVESKIYSVSYRDKNDEVLFSDVKMKINPIGKVKELYLVINGDPEKIKFNGDMKIEEEKTNSISVSLGSLEGSRTIEFLHPEAIDILNLPIYISPEFKYLPIILDTKECNLNGKCETDLGESYINCSDCHVPWFGKAFFWIIILFVLAFIAYILLQEWYKRYYESSLFKDKNNLFNLINYINNSELHGVSRVEIYKQLKEMGWKDEQVEYAWNKLHGLRTGMWEIPLFKVFENNKIKNELRRRQQIGEKISPTTPSKVSTRIMPRNPQRIPPRNQPSFPRSRFKRYSERH